MKFLLYFSFFLFVSCATKPSKNIDSMLLADCYVSFGSVCCGTTSAEPLVNYTLSFLTKENLSFPTMYIERGLGKEGEFALAYVTKDWTDNQLQEFVDGIRKLHWKDQESNSFGGVTVFTNYKMQPIEMSLYSLELLTEEAFLGL